VSAALLNVRLAFADGGDNGAIVYMSARARARTGTRLKLVSFKCCLVPSGRMQPKIVGSSAFLSIPALVEEARARVLT